MTKPVAHPAALLMLVRTWHAYVGLLIAPTVIFMALTGILQIYSLHEARPGYTPPPLIEKLGRVHKDQVFAVARHGPPPSARPRPTSQPPARKATTARLATTLLKAVFAAVAVGLTGSTLAGVWMALRQGPRRRRHMLLLLAGFLVPLILAALSA